MSLLLTFALIVLTCASAIVVLASPMFFRCAIVASTVLVTANPEIPLHLIPAGLIGIYCLVRPWRAKLAFGAHRSHPLIIVGVFTLAICISWLNAVPNEYETAANTAIRLLMHVSVYGILALETKTPREWSRYVIVYIGSVAAEALFGMSTYLSQRAYDVVRTGYIMESGVRRLTGIHGDPNFLAVLIAPAILYGIAYLPFFHMNSQRLCLVAAIAVLAVALALTLSRTGALTFGIGLFTWAVISRRKSLAIGVATLLAAVFLVSFIELGLVDEAAQRLDIEQGTSWSHRTAKWLDVLNNLTAGVVMTGGLGRSRLGSMTPHQTYLSLILELGLLGMGAYLAAVSISVVGCWRFYRQHRMRGHSRDLYAAAASASVGLFVAGFGLDLISEKGTWVVLGLTAALCRLGRTEDYLPFSPAFALRRHGGYPVHYAARVLQTRRRISIVEEHKISEAPQSE